MVANALAVNLLGSHAMPDLVTPLVSFSLFWSGAPVLLCALWGAGIGWKSIRWRQLGGAALGLLIGWATVLPVFFLAFLMLVRFGFTPWLPCIIAAEFIGCLAGAGVAYRVARIGRPTPPAPTLTTLSENLAQLEQIVRQQFSAAGFEVGPVLEMDVLQTAEVLSYEQAALFVDIRKMRDRFMRARVVNHDDVASWVRKSNDLLTELCGTATDEPLAHTGGDSANPYLPPGHRHTTHNG
jgi:hypothetical protein